MCGRQTDMQSVFLLKLKSLWTLDRHTHHLSYRVGPKSPPHNFFVLINLDCFHLGTSLKKLCFKPRQWHTLYRSLAKGNIPFRPTNRQVHRQTDKQVGRHIYSAELELADLISLSVNGQSPNCQWTVYVYYKCLISRKRTIPNISQSTPVYFMWVW